MSLPLSRCLLSSVALACLVLPCRAGTSSSLLDIAPDGTKLLVANSDNGSVSVVCLKENKVLREIKVGDKPEGVAWLGAGPLAAVTVFRDDLIVFFDADTGHIVKKLEAADEPYAIVTSRDGARAWVTHEYPGAVSEIDTRAHKVIREIKVGSFIRGLALSPDESRLYVSEFYSGVLHAVDLKSGTVVDSWMGHSTDNLCRSVIVHPRRPKAYLTHIRSKIDTIDGGGSIFPQLSICDLVPPNNTRRRTSVGLDTYNGIYVTTNAWESALSPDGRRLYTIYAGTNDMNVSEIVDDDYKEVEHVRVMTVGQNHAVRVSADSKTVYVYNALDFAVNVYAAEGMKRTASIKVCDPPKTPEWVRGKVLFSTALPPLSGRRWVACASCHPDGHSDGRAWQNPEGLRKTPPMFGLAHTHPLHWSADRDEVQDFEYTIRSPLMRGSGLLKATLKPKVKHHPIELEEPLSGRSADLDALAIYTNSFEFTLSPHAAGGKLSPAAERGKALFFSKETACASCHNSPYYSDSRLEKPYHLHDVGTGTADTSEKMGPKYDTPTLLGVYRSPPYLHHGQAKTLHDVLTVFNKEDKHGKTSHLKKAEIDDLVEFLKALPYEKPPDETPNTVKYRIPPVKKE